MPTEVDAPAVNRWLFNENTVDQVLQHLMQRGIKVAGGDRLGKTIIFAKNHEHAEFIVERFDHHYPHFKGHFARLIDFQVTYAQSLIDEFQPAREDPHIAVSVDMLDTGIDVPEVVNLAFFKVVRSKTKFWQMIGRGTRLSADLFGPGRDKKNFRIFDYLSNLEYFSMNPDAVDGWLPESLGKRLFTSRVELVVAIDELQNAGEGEKTLRREVAELLRNEVAAMNLDNFVVRPKRQIVERFAVAAAWDDLTTEAVSELTGGVAGLPSSVMDEDEDAKRFDLLLLQMQLALLNHEAGFARMQAKVMEIGSLLEEKSAIPIVAAQLVLLHAIQTDEFWTDVQVIATRRSTAEAAVAGQADRKGEANDCLHGLRGRAWRGEPHVPCRMCQLVSTSNG